MSLSKSWPASHASKTGVFTYAYTEAEFHGCLLVCGSDMYWKTLDNWFKRNYPDRHSEGEGMSPFTSPGFQFRVVYHRWLKSVGIGAAVLLPVTELWNEGK